MKKWYIIEEEESNEIMKDNKYSNNEWLWRRNDMKMIMIMKMMSILWKWKWYENDENDDVVMKRNDKGEW